MRQSIRFIHQGRIRELNDVDPTQTLLNFLRYEEARVGTKEGCAEGDCGACSVVLGDIHKGRLRYQAVNACIQFLPMLDGKELITVEDLKSDDGSLHPVQQALVDKNGTQCGFCTPGFALSMFAHMHSGNSENRGDINDALAGNLCRCTGYGTIIDAAKSVAVQNSADKFILREEQTLGLLRSFEKDESLTLDHFFAPKTATELCELLDTHPKATLLAGATDVGLWVTKLHRDLGTVIYLGQVGDLKNIDISDGHLIIGAGVTYNEAWAHIENEFDDFGELIRRIASTQIRNSGTIGGNIANGSPIGDMPPALIALGAKLTLQSSAGQREIDLEDFFVAYSKQDLKTSEFVRQVSIPRPKSGDIFRNYKISKRFDQDISALCGAFNMRLNGNVVEDIRICFGGMAGTPARAKLTERFLIGKEWTEDNIETALVKLSQDYSPLSDMRASKEYRMMVTQNLLRKFHAETTAPDALTRLVGKGSIADA